MDLVVESALISATATLVGIGGTAVVAIAGFRFSRRTLDDTRDGQMADRYTKAIEQLGSKELLVSRISAVGTGPVSLSHGNVWFDHEDPRVKAYGERLG